MKSLFSILFLGVIVMFLVSCKGKGNESNAAEQTADTLLVSHTDNAGQIYQIVPAATKVFWEGYKPAMGTTHRGAVNVSEGKITVQDGIIAGGSFVMDMNTIVVNDLEGQSKERLEAHLKGTAQGKENDFFNVAQYPRGQFDITKVTVLENDPEANMMIYGNLTIRDITKPVAFKAQVSINNGTLTATTPLFKIDRTEWDIKVLSKKFYDNLKDGFVDDLFGLRIELKAEAGKDM